ncbi:YggT family protein [Kurthia sibirica]|uniref:YggT family protein n=1 Tax=Kurthia sibirica TaxID=202750 RepID=A0A2U3AQK5_9BACL|nr:YggT family protein [Kurthia sibirica]PWI26823.1 hypothetical protein DEX24_00560 [Kurthia sibirica]GEK32640.1 membrane protein [Kurthia sibirica]
MILLLNILGQAFTIYSYAILVYVLMSWVPAIQQSKFGFYLGKIVEPYLNIFRRIIPPIGMIDISPIVAILALQFIARGALNILSYLVF